MSDMFDMIAFELDSLPSSDELINMCSPELSSNVLDGIRELELDPGDTLGCLWAECLEAGFEPEEYFRGKGIIR